MNEVAVSLKGVSKTFDGRDYILNNLDLDVPRGKITVIIGYSGTGKSVMLKHILGLIQPTKGEIRVFDENIVGMSLPKLTEIRKKYGVLFQYAALFDDMTALENVMFPLTEHWGNFSLTEKEEIAKERLTESGLSAKHFNKLPSELSGGMRKRVGLARALALDPEILIYDEPTTGLDPILTEMVDNLIVSAQGRKEGTTSIVVSHDLYAAFRIGDYVAMLDEGRVLLKGTADDFLNSDISLVKRFVEKGFYKRMDKKGNS